MLNVEMMARISSFADEEEEFEELLMSNPPLLDVIYQRCRNQKVPVPRNREEISKVLWDSITSPEIEDLSFDCHHLCHHWFAWSFQLAGSMLPPSISPTAAI
jgi:hypothetical protein